MFKSFKVKVENQLNKRIKSVKFDHGGDTTIDDGLCEQRPRPFAKYLEECGILPQNTMSGSHNMTNEIEG